MELFNPKNLKFDFVKLFKPALVISAVLSLAGVVSIVFPGLNYGIDFRGGVEARIEFPKGDVTQAQLREVLEKKVPGVSIVNFEGVNKNEFLIIAQAHEKDDVSKILSTYLEEVYGPKGERWRISQMDVVGPKVGSELRKSALLSLLYTCILITLYMYWRFDMRYSPGAIACIFHDLAMTAGFLVLTHTEFSTVIVAALLTLAGYSINDTVVVYDRIRELENRFKARDKDSLVNEAINSTLSRTIMTAGTTLVSCAVLYFLGGPAIRDFAKTLFFGIVVGTYSSAFVAAPLYIWANKKFSPQSALTPTKAKG